MCFKAVSEKPAPKSAVSRRACFFFFSSAGLPIDGALRAALLGLDDLLADPPLGAHMSKRISPFGGRVGDSNLAGRL